MTKSAQTRLLAALLIVGLVAFSVCLVQAVLAYPGGTCSEPNATSHRFWGNFFCDLTRPVTARGANNARSAGFARDAFAAFGVATGAFFWLLGDMTGRRAVIRVPGTASAVATVLLAWVPSGLGPVVHLLAVFSTTIPGLFAAGVGVHALWRQTARTYAERAARRLGLATFAAAVTNAVGYTYAVVAQAGCLPWLAALQKLVAMLLVAFMGSVALARAVPSQSKRGD